MSPTAVWWCRSDEDGGALILDQEDDVGARGAAELDAIAVLERALRDLLAVDEGAVARAAVAEHVGAVGLGDLRVIARDVAAGQADVVLAAPTDGNQRLVERDDTAAQPVVDFEACSWHGPVRE